MTYIFDFDGTLVDSMPIFSKTIIKLFDEYKLPYTDDTVGFLTPLGYKGIAEYAITLGLKMSKAEFIKKATDYMSYEYHNNIPAKKFVKEKLKELKNNGCSLNVLTACPHALLDGCLKRLNLFNLFDYVLSCDDFNLKKSKPTIYIKTAELLNTPINECMFLDDNISAIRAAKKSGIYTVGVFDASSKEYIREIKSIADKYINDFSEL